MPATTVARPPSGLDRDLEELELLVVGERRRLAGRAADDDPVGAVLDEELRELEEAVEVDASVCVGTASRSR